MLVRFSYAYAPYALMLMRLMRLCLCASENSIRQISGFLCFCLCLCLSYACAYAYAYALVKTSLNSQLTNGTPFN